MTDMSISTLSENKMHLMNISCDKNLNEIVVFLLLHLINKETILILFAREKQQFVFAKTKTQISCAVTAQLIRAFVFANWMHVVQFLF